MLKELIRHNHDLIVRCSQWTKLWSSSQLTVNSSRLCVTKSNNILTNFKWGPPVLEELMIWFVNRNLSNVVIIGLVRRTGYSKRDQPSGNNLLNRVYICLHLQFKVRLSFKDRTYIQRYSSSIFLTHLLFYCTSLMQSCPYLVVLGRKLSTH